MIVYVVVRRGRIHGIFDSKESAIESVKLTWPKAEIFDHPDAKDAFIEPFMSFTINVLNYELNSVATILEAEA